jgi:Uncharacterized conserved protein (DUF2358)
MRPTYLPLLLLISSHITGLLSFATVSKLKTVSCYGSSNIQVSRSRHGAKSSSETTEEYRDPVTKFLGAFISKEKSEDKLSMIDWNKPKRKKVPLVSLAKTLEVELTKKEWFVNGNVDASFFSDDFTFQDPDVKIKGIEQYARGVNKIFSQKNARAEIIAVRKNDEAENTLTVTWRLSGSVNLGPGLQIKPFIVLTDFVVSPSDGLIVFQEDRFSLPGSDIVLSAFFPFLIEKFLLPPAQPADILKAEFLEKEKELMKSSSPGGNPFMKLFKK